MGSMSYAMYPHVTPLNLQLSAAALDHGNKRRQIGGYPDPSLRKRNKSSVVDIQPISAAQRNTLVHAASILQKPSSYSLDLAAKLQRKHKCPSKLQSSISPAMAETPSYGVPSSRRPYAQSMPSVPEKGIMQRPSSLSATCSMPSFGMRMISKRIADCFASLASNASRPVAGTEYPNESSCYLPMAYSSNLPLDAHGPESSIFSATQQVQSHSSLDPMDFWDSNQPSMGFAYNDLMPDSYDWIAPMGNILPLQHSQPTSALPTMTYSPDIGIEGKPYIPSICKHPGNNFNDDCSCSSNQDRLFDLIDLSPKSSLEVKSSESGDSHNIESSGPTRRRPFQNPYHRQQTAQTRKLTACIRCRMQRIRCEPDPKDPTGICLTCKRLLKPKLHKNPCHRYKLTDVRLFREGSFAAGHEWSHRWSNKMENITCWASSHTKTIEVTQDYGQSSIEFIVGEFVPIAGDMLHREWADGRHIRSVKIPNYAIVNMNAALEAHKKHIVSDSTQYFKSALEYSDILLRDTYNTAIKYSNAATISDGGELLQMVLQLWVTIRMCVKSQRISGAETLGMSPDIMIRSSPMHGKIPVPPVLAAQAQFIVTQKLQAPLRVKILDLLQRLTLAQKPSNWFYIYLCTFILLHNCSLLTQHDIGYARKHGLKTRHARLDMVRELHHGANVLLGHFQYSCKGFKPFNLDWNPEETTSMADLNVEQIRFVRQTARYVNFNEPRFKQRLNKGSYEQERYFVDQLFEKDWSPRFTV